MNLIHLPKSPNQIAGIAMGVAGVVVGLALFAVAYHILDTRYGGAVSPSELRAIGGMSLVLTIGFLGMGYSVFTEH